ncbi:DUF6602 domain-containing protein [Paenibacillus motobuensis]|uniref:DUF6602 domain-containing protein n=1 Tax=Paenibacillus motobuensis TaxID=295324 RepID=A0ABN0Y8U0_9BACL
MITRAIQTAAKKMMIDFEELTSQIKHKGERGTSREELLIRYLKGYFPLKFSLGRGTIIDSRGTQSKQQDCIIYDSFNSPILLDMETTQMIPIESVYATIEVKSSLNKTELIKCVNNIKSVRELPKHPIYPVNSNTAGFVFAFTSDTSIETILGNLIDCNKEIELENQISIICILDKGLIIHVNKAGLKDFVLLPSQDSTPVIIENSVEMNLMLFYLFLMQYLNSEQVSSPNLFKYADHDDVLKINWSLPAKFVPSGSSVNIDGRLVDANKAIDLSKRLKVMESIQAGIATKEQLMDFFANEFIEALDITTDNKNLDDNFIFFDKKFSLASILAAGEIHKKIVSGMKLDEEELSSYRLLFDNLYMHYKDCFETYNKKGTNS